ncbi:unnamed protein product, partial [Rotaria socialis]
MDSARLGYLSSMKLINCSSTVGKSSRTSLRCFANLLDLLNGNEIACLSNSSTDTKREWSFNGMIFNFFNLAMV